MTNLNLQFWADLLLIWFSIKAKWNAYVISANDGNLDVNTFSFTSCKVAFNMHGEMWNVNILFLSENTVKRKHLRSSHWSKSERNCTFALVASKKLFWFTKRCLFTRKLKRSAIQVPSKLASHYRSVRPGQGFWVYGIRSPFNSAIWYFLSQFGYKVSYFSGF